MPVPTLPPPFKDALLYRPFVWVAAAALLGIVLGQSWMQRAGWRDQSEITSLPLGLAVVLLGLSVVLRQYGWAWRTLLGSALVLFFGWHTVGRMLPPAGDISRQIDTITPPRGPFPLKEIQVRGVVEGFPKKSDFATQFALRCRAPLAGNIWVTAPFNTSLGPGDEVSLKLVVRPLPLPGNPGERDSRWHYIQSRCWVLGRARNSSDVKVLQRATQFTASSAIAVMRAGLLQHYTSAFTALETAPYAGAMGQIMTAMVFGEGGLQTPLPSLVREHFRDAGLSHLLVASGSQVALLAAGLLMGARILGVRRWPLWFLVVPALVLYAGITGGEASIWRATLAGVGLTAALLLGREADGLSLWSLAAFILLLLDPSQAWSLSFQLTFGATFGLIALAPGIQDRLVTHFGKGPVQELAALSLGAQLATLPISLFHFGSFSVAGIGANFLAVPLASLLVGSGTLGLVYDPVNYLNYWLCRGLSVLATGAAALPGARWGTQMVPLLSCWALFLVLAVPLLGSSADRRVLYELLRTKLRQMWARARLHLPPRPAVVLAWVLLLAATLTWAAWRTKPDGLLRVTVLDVGQGEAILLQSNGRSALIDGGAVESQPRSNIGRAVLIPALHAAGITRLDLMVVTHADADHCNGLKQVLEEVPVGLFVDGPAATEARPNLAATDYVALRQELDRRKVKRMVPRPGTALEFGAAKISILAPTAPPLAKENDNAVVLRVDIGASSVLLTGDIEAEAEQRLLRSGARLDCTVLKVAHHGSQTSTSQAFIQAASPSLALISCGRFNPHGHPHVGVLERLRAASVPVLRTDVSGALTVTCSQTACEGTSFR